MPPSVVNLFSRKDAKKDAKARQDFAIFASFIAPLREIFF